MIVGTQFQLSYQSSNYHTRVPTIIPEFQLSYQSSNYHTRVPTIIPEFMPEFHSGMIWNSGMIVGTLVWIVGTLVWIVGTLVWIVGILVWIVGTLVKLQRTVSISLSWIYVCVGFDMNHTNSQKVGSMLLCIFTSTYVSSRRIDYFEHL